MPTDPAVEALAEVLGGPRPGYYPTNDLDLARDALDHIAAHLHADTPEGAALRERLGDLGIRAERDRLLAALSRIDDALHRVDDLR